VNVRWSGEISQERASDGSAAPSRACSVSPSNSASAGLMSVAPVIIPGSRYSGSPELQKTR
jgi:hypothetical protein